ncbi:unnamed protein product [Cuscuta campestris]|uniref:Uncharacterized protein n=1 Tax=Cuscuta campestris TaxID=132261 RepID=A0A484LAX6_9ASTE|nr:unnamed protein product [Cuscuta campestris]
MTLVGNVLTEQVLVEWSEGGPDDAMWKSLAFMRKQFLRLHLADKVLVEDGGNDRDANMNEAGMETENNNDNVGSSGEESNAEMGSSSEGDREMHVGLEAQEAHARRSTRPRRSPRWRKDYV